MYLPSALGNRLPMDSEHDFLNHAYRVCTTTDTIMIWYIVQKFPPAFSKRIIFSQEISFYLFFGFITIYRAPYKSLSLIFPFRFVLCFPRSSSSAPVIDVTARWQCRKFNLIVSLASPWRIKSGIAGNTFRSSDCPVQRLLFARSFVHQSCATFVRVNQLRWYRFIGSLASLCRLRQLHP